MDDIDWSALTAKLPTGRDTAATLRRAELFDRFDINGNGVLSLAEVDKAMRDVMGLDSVYSSKPVIMRAFQAARDHNGHKKTTAKRKGADDYVERDEFRTLLVYLRQYFELYVAFNRLDLNNDDRVDVCEFRNSLETLGKWGIEITPEQAEEEFAKIDLNGGGAVLFDEFCHWAISKNLDLEDDDDFDDAAVDGQDGHLKRHARKAAAAGAKAKEVQTSKWQNKGSKQIAEANLVHAKIISASQGREDAARERLVRLRARAQRELTRAAAVAATEQQRERRRLAVAQVRAETDQMIGRDVTARVRDVPDLSKEELFTLSELFNTQLQKATKGDNARTFFQLFKDLDIDGSRRIGFNELERMVRGKLHLSERRLEQQKLYGLWKNLDENKSGYIDTGELSRFLRIGAPKTLTAVQRARLKLQASRNGRMARIRAEVDKEQEKDVVNKLDEVEKATDEEVQQFGFLFHKQLAILRPRGQDNISFYGLFKRMDVDASGRVNFDEFKRMIRLGMQVDAKELPEKTMWGLWKVIDENANGFICGGEVSIVAALEPLCHYSWCLLTGCLSHLTFGPRLCATVCPLHALGL